jgi:hypothetical protein
VCGLCVCVRARVCVRLVRAWVHVCMRAWVGVRAWVCVCVCAYLRACVGACMRARVHVCLWRGGVYLYLYLYAAVSNGKLKPRRFFLIRLPFTHRENGNLYFVRLLTKKKTEVTRLQTD